MTQYMRQIFPPKFVPLQSSRTSSQLSLHNSMPGEEQDAVSVFERDTGGYVKAAKTDIELRRLINGAGDSKV